MTECYVGECPLHEGDEPLGFCSNSAEVKALCDYARRLRGERDKAISELEKSTIPPWMIMAAFRYALGRSTYIAPQCALWLQENDDMLDGNTRSLFIREIRDALEGECAGMGMDRKHWEETLQTLLEGNEGDGE